MVYGENVSENASAENVQMCTRSYDTYRHTRKRNIDTGTLERYHLLMIHEKLPHGKLAVKLIALDLDDTLLNTELKISPRTISALRRAAAQGIFVVIASGRPESAILPFVRALDIAGLETGRYILALNGALIFDLHERRPIFSKKISGDVLEQIFFEAHERGLCAEIYDGSIICVSEETKWSRIDAELSGLTLKVISDFPARVKNGYAKMLISADPKDVDAFLPVLRKKFSGAADFFISKPFFLEVLPPGCGKGEALAFLSDMLGIDRSETMAFGDSMNDESMIRMSGHGVAMSNGLTAIRDAAAYVTRKTNDEDGIADFLEAFVL